MQSIWNNPKSKWYKMIRIVEAKTDIGKMYYLVDENYDFIPVIKEFLDMIQARSHRTVSPNTIRTYCYDLRYFLIFLKIRNLKILQLDGEPSLLAEYKLWLKNPYRFYENVQVLYYDNNSDSDYLSDELKVSTINQYIDRVSSLYLWLKACNRIVDNPVIYRDVIVTQSMRDRDLLAHTRRGRTIKVNALKSKLPNVIPKTISQNKFKQFLNSVNLLRDKIILLCLKEGGIRASEMLGIHLEDIDFAEQGLWVKFRDDNINGARAKSGYGRDRFIHLPADLMYLIDRYISSEWIESNSDSDFLFVVVNSNIPSQNGSPMNKSTLDSLFRYYSKKNEFHLFPHMLRHTHATELARDYIKKGEKINWEFISKRLGHSSITTTIEIYAHLCPEDYKNEYSRLKNYNNDKKIHNNQIIL